MGHSTEKKPLGPLGNTDIVAGLIAFVALYFFAYWIAGPNGYAFLKGMLTPELANELLISGCLLLFLWTVVSPLVIEPYLAAFYEREAKTKGLATENVTLRKELSELKNELKAEVRTAKLEGVRRKNEKVAEAKKQAAEILEEGGRVVDQKWSEYEEALTSSKGSLMKEVESEVPALSSQLTRKVIGDDASSVVH